jgi:hypothetical protein
VKKLYQSHCSDDLTPTEVDADIQKEYNRQREYLEKSVESLKRKLHKDMESHRQVRRSVSVVAGELPKGFWAREKP